MLKFCGLDIKSDLTNDVVEPVNIWLLRNSESTDEEEDPFFDLPPELFLRGIVGRVKKTTCCLFKSCGEGGDGAQGM